LILAWLSDNKISMYIDGIKETILTCHKISSRFISIPTMSKFNFFIYKLCCSRKQSMGVPCNGQIAHQNGSSWRQIVNVGMASADRYDKARDVVMLAWWRHQGGGCDRRVHVPTNNRCVYWTMYNIGSNAISRDPSVGHGWIHLYLPKRISLVDQLYRRKECNIYVCIIPFSFS
jgi:hypothetical protein